MIEVVGWSVIEESAELWLHSFTACICPWRVETDHPGPPGTGEVGKKNLSQYRRLPCGSEADEKWPVAVPHECLLPCSGYVGTCRVTRVHSGTTFLLKLWDYFALLFSVVKFLPKVHALPVVALSFSSIINTQTYSTYVTNRL